MAAVCWLVLLDMLPELADDLGVAEKNLERRLHRAATRPHPGPHTRGAVVCRQLLMLQCCTGGLLSLEMMIGGLEMLSGALQHRPYGVQDGVVRGVRSCGDGGSSSSSSSSSRVGGCRGGVLF